jgi:hypothetical protein
VDLQKRPELIQQESGHDSQAVILVHYFLA